MESVNVETPRRLIFSEFVNVITVLAMFEKDEAERFVFGMLDPDHTGFIHRKEYISLGLQLYEGQKAVFPADRMRDYFDKVSDDFHTVSFAVVSKRPWCFAVGVEGWNVPHTPVVPED